VEVPALLWGVLLNVAVEAFDGRFVAAGLDMPVGVRGLADARVPELLLHPPQVRAVVTPPTMDARKRPPPRFSPNRWPGPAGEPLPDGHLEPAASVRYDAGHRLWRIAEKEPGGVP
jgi:hypothetical protein